MISIAIIIENTLPSTQYHLETRKVARGVQDTMSGNAMRRSTNASLVVDRFGLRVESLALCCLSIDGHEAGESKWLPRGLHRLIPAFDVAVRLLTRSTAFLADDLVPGSTHRQHRLGKTTFGLKLVACEDNRPCVTALGDCRHFLRFHYLHGLHAFHPLHRLHALHDDGHVCCFPGDSGKGVRGGVA